MHCMAIVSVVLVAFVALFAVRQFTQVEITVKDVGKTVNKQVELLKEIQVEHLDLAITKLIDLADHGYFGIESTESRKLRYLKDAKNDYGMALNNALKRMNNPLQKVINGVLSGIPFAGIPYSLVVPYWQKTRYLLLVATLNNHTTSDPDVHEAVTDCLINSAFYDAGHKTRGKLITKAISYAGKFFGSFGFKLFGSIVSIPVNTLLSFLDNDKTIIECGKEKFGR